MWLRHQVTERARTQLSFKRGLLELNRRLDKIKADVADSRDFDPVVYDIQNLRSYLTPFERMLLYMEDRRFFLHRGVEARGFLRGLRRLFSGRTFGGVSTIDQQAVRISLGRYERTARRKANELLLAYLLNIHHSKRDIFEYYARNAYLGYEMKGCEQASQKCFGRASSELNVDQCAFIVSLYPLPFPKAVYQASAAAHGAPTADPEVYLTLGETHAPRWASRMRFRMKLARFGYDFRPRSL